MKQRKRGFSLLELMVVLAILAIIFAIAVPNMVEARKYANEGAAIASIKAILSAEILYREGDSDRDDSLDYGSLAELASQRLVDTALGTGTKSGYRFQVSYAVATGEFLFFAVGNPVFPAATGERYFCTNQTGVIYYTTASSISLDTVTCAIPPGTTPIQR